jgi:hypothetical protein
MERATVPGVRVAPVILPKHILIASTVEQHIGYRESQHCVISEVAAPIKEWKILSFDLIPLVNRADNITSKSAYHNPSVRPVIAPQCPTHRPSACEDLGISGASEGRITCSWPELLDDLGELQLRLKPCGTA